MKQDKFAPGLDEERVQRFFDYYENQTEDDAVTDAEEAFCNDILARIDISLELVSVVEDLISKHKRGPDYDSKNDFENAIKDHNTAIRLKPDLGVAFVTFAIIRLLQHKWSDAKFDLSVAKDLGTDIVAVYTLFYDNVEDFEKQNSVQLPEKIAAMLRKQ